MKKDLLNTKRFCEFTGKLHIPCPHKEKSGIYIHVVVKGGYCYRSDECMVIECKFNRLQGDIERILSVTW
jgi:hypothetical protein